MAVSKFGCAGWLVLLCFGQDISSQDSVSYGRAIDGRDANRALYGVKMRDVIPPYTLPQICEANGKDEASKVRCIQG
jgi:hypothetical protein